MTIAKHGHSNCVYLVWSTMFFLIPLFMFFRKRHRSKYYFYENILAILLICNIVLSVLFWIGPEQYSDRHLYDGYFAKISFVLFSVYVLCVKPLSLELYRFAVTMIGMVTISMYYSNECSREKWCSQKHVVAHSLFHLLSSIGCSIAFV
jgi:hypothetical protein